MDKVMVLIALSRKMDASSFSSLLSYQTFASTVEK